MPHRANCFCEDCSAARRWSWYLGEPQPWTPKAAALALTVGLCGTAAAMILLGKAFLSARPF